jgi:DNA-binding CsgD family transcriptional regulator
MTINADHNTPLSHRIVKSVARGATYSEISSREFMSVRSVGRVVASLKAEVGANSLSELCVEAARRGWLDH